MRKNRLIPISLCVLYLLILWVLAAGRDPDLTDEGFYLYDAWVAYDGNPGTFQSNPAFINQGYIIGVPYLLFQQPSLVELRIFSLLAWTLAFAAFFFSFSTNKRSTNLVVLTTGLMPSTILIPTLSYQTIPIVFSVAAAALFKLGSHCESRLLMCASGLTLSFCLLGFTPSVAGVSIAALLVLLLYPNKRLASHHTVSVLLATGFVLSLVYFNAVTSPFPSPVEEQSIVDLVTRVVSKYWDLVLATVIPSLIGLPMAVFFATKPATRPFVTLTIPLFWFFIEFFDFTPLHQSISRYPVFSVSAFTLPLLLATLIQNKTLSPVNLTTLLMPVFVTLIVEGLGGNPAPYYFNYLAPAFLGLLFLEFSKLGSFKSSQFFRSSCLSSLITLVVFAQYKALTSAYRGASPLETNAVVAMSHLRGSKMSSKRAETIQAFADTYKEFACEEKSFAALDRTPFAYWMVERSSPFGVSWVGKRAPELQAVVAKQQRGCILFREFWLKRTDSQDVEAFISYLNLKGADITVQQIGTEGLALLSFEPEQKRQG